MGTKANQKTWTAGLLEEVLEGQWLNNKEQDLNITDLAINRAGCTDKNTLFIAIDEDRWHKGSGNRGINAGWTDTHKTLPKFEEKVSAAIVEREILGLKAPQILVENSYDTIKKLGGYAREQMSGTIIAITGTVGKSSTRMMLSHLLKANGTVVATKGNHNTRTGVPLTMARCITNPDYCVLEVAISALWMRSGGICEFAKPHIGIVTEVGLGQVGGVNDELSTAKMKARVCQGIVPGGTAILNRDMDHYDVVKAEVESFGAVPLTYGFNKEADIYVKEWQPVKRGSLVTVSVKGEIYTYELPVPGEGMISNSLAAAAALYALGLDIKKALRQFDTLRLRESVLEYIEKELPSGKVSILDDTYNSTMISMRSALKVFKRQAEESKRKIGVLGRVVNLGEHAEKLHRELAQDILDVGFDKVFLHGEEMKYVLDELPRELVGGYFQNTKDMGHVVADYLKDGDYILMKGSRRGTDFGKIRQNLLTAIDHPVDITNIDRGLTVTSSYSVTVHDISQENIIYKHGDLDNAKYSKKQGLGPVLLIGYLLDEVALGNIKLGKTVKVSNVSGIKSVRNIGLTEGQEITVFELLNAILIKNSPDAIVALGQALHGNRNKTHNKLREIAKSIKLDTRTVENLSGRRMRRKTQFYTPKEFIRASTFLFQRLPYFRKFMAADGYAFNNGYEAIPTNLYTSGTIEAGYFFNDGKNATAVYTYKGKEYIINVLEAENAFHRDYLIKEGIHRIHLSEEATKQMDEKQEMIEVNSKQDDIKINLIGDTYFGEFYTEIRKRRGREDALTKYGYDYSFQGIQKMLNEGDFNIANFEAALTEIEHSPFKQIKPYTLKGKPEESVNALKNAKIDAVSLGNNHAMDFGAEGLKSTMNAFESAGIHHFGAGLSSDEAEKPLRLKVNNRTLVFISAYWYRRYMHEKFDFYAMPESPGVACISGGLREVIAREKELNEDAYIIALPHWGVDFGEVKKEQRELAKKLVSYGADLVIGHGAHMAQEIEVMDGKYVIYSIGNGVFNSNGEYDRRNVAPVSYFVQLKVTKEGKVSLELYPLYCNNLKTFWQPRQLSEEEAKEFGMKRRMVVF